MHDTFISKQSKLSTINSLNLTKWKFDKSQSLFNSTSRSTSVGNTYGSLNNTQREYDFKTNKNNNSKKTSYLKNENLLKFSIQNQNFTKGLARINEIKINDTNMESKNSSNLKNLKNEHNFNLNKTKVAPGYLMNNSISLIDNYTNYSTLANNNYINVSTKNGSSYNYFDENDDEVLKMEISNLDSNKKTLEKEKANLEASNEKKFSKKIQELNYPIKNKGYNISSLIEKQINGVRNIFLENNPLKIPKINSNNTNETNLSINKQVINKSNRALYSSSSFNNKALSRIIDSKINTHEKNTDQAKNLSLGINNNNLINKLDANQIQGKNNVALKNENIHKAKNKCLFNDEKNENTNNIKIENQNHNCNEIFSIEQLGRKVENNDKNFYIKKNNPSEIKKNVFELNKGSEKNNSSSNIDLKLLKDKSRNEPIQSIRMETIHENKNKNLQGKNYNETKEKKEINSKASDSQGFFKTFSLFSDKIKLIQKLKNAQIEEPPIKKVKRPYLNYDNNSKFIIIPKKEKQSTDKKDGSIVGKEDVDSKNEEIITKFLSENIRNDYNKSVDRKNMSKTFFRESSDIKLSRSNFNLNKTYHRDESLKLLDRKNSNNINNIKSPERSDHENANDTDDTKKSVTFQLMEEEEEEEEENLAQDEIQKIPKKSVKSIKKKFSKKQLLNLFKRRQKTAELIKKTVSSIANEQMNINNRILKPFITRDFKNKGFKLFKKFFKSSDENILRKMHDYIHQNIKLSHEEISAIESKLFIQ